MVIGKTAQHLKNGRKVMADEEWEETIIDPSTEDAWDDE